MGNPVVHFEIGVKDASAANKFYADLFGWKIDSSNPMNYGIVDTDSGGEGVGGGIMKPPEGAGTYTTFYVNVEDLQATLDQAEKLGAKTIMPPMQVPEGPEIAMFSDPDGNVIGLSKM
jgi:predicted enzyme related to lactoylglutathione lyase